MYGQIVSVPVLCQKNGKKKAHTRFESGLSSRFLKTMINTHLKAHNNLSPHQRDLMLSLLNFG